MHLKHKASVCMSLKNDIGALVMFVKADSFSCCFLSRFFFNREWPVALTVRHFHKITYFIKENETQIYGLYWLKLKILNTKHQNKNRASPLTYIKIISTCFKKFPAETAIPVFYLVLGRHEYLTISLNFVIFLKGNGRLRIREISSVKFPPIL